MPVLAPVVNYLEPVTASWHGVPSLSPNQMNVTLDGRQLRPTRVTSSRPYRIASAVPGNPVGLRNGMRVADDGYWVFITPGLTPGRHTLDIRASSVPPRLWTLVAA